MTTPMDRRSRPLLAVGLVVGTPALVVAAGMVAFELLLHPRPAERGELLALFAGPAGVAALASVVLWRFAARSRSLASTIAAVGLVVVGVIGLAVALGAWRMFLSGHDLRLLTVVLLVGAGLGVVVALSASRSLTADLDVVHRTADRVSADDLAARTGVDRADELGAAAAALDRMIDRLAETEELRRADDVARRNLLAAIGHDLRTPLAALQAAVEALQDGLAPDPDRYLSSMGQHVTALGGLVADLFLLARIEAGELGIERRPVDLAELADETIEALAPLAHQRSVELRLETTGRIPVLGRPEELGRALRNLVDNAIRHAPPATPVVVRVTHRDGDSDCAGRDGADSAGGAGPGLDGGAAVEVVDRGPGFSTELVPSAFDSFVRAEPSRSRGTGGAGLGLAIARGVVEAHGGTIWARPGPGGHVGFRLPAPDA